MPAVHRLGLWECPVDGEVHAEGELPHDLAYPYGDRVVIEAEYLYSHWIKNERKQRKKKKYIKYTLGGPVVSM